MIIIDERRKKLSDDEKTFYKNMYSLTEEFLKEFENSNNSKKFNELKKFYIDLKFRVISPLIYNQEIRTSNLESINKIFYENIDLFERYKFEYLDKSDNAALEQIRAEMSDTQAQEKTQSQVRKNK